VFCALILSIAITTAAGAAQDPPPVPPPVPAVTAPPATAPQSGPPATPVQSLPPAASAAPPPQAPVLPPLDEATVKQRRAEIKNMEGVFTSAVRNAAQEIASQMQTPETGPFQLTGSLIARGFILDGYGVFFHVEIPGVQPTVISPVALELLRKGLPRLAQPETASSGSASPAAPLNSDAVYVERVKSALMRAMIQYSKPLGLRPDEWLTVAAGDGDEPFLPAVLTEQAVMVLRIRGRDIAEYLAERLTLDEVLKRVEVRRF
jgi:hypothetical protein